MLYEMMRAALADPHKRLKGMWDHEDVAQRIMLKKTYDKINEATRFEMDDDFTTAAEKASLLDVRKLATLFTRARPPYDLMWIEWNRKPRSAYHKIWAKEQSVFVAPEDEGKADDRQGYLIERITDVPGRDSLYRISEFSYKSGEEGLGMWPMGLIIDLDEVIIDRNLITKEDVMAMVTSPDKTPFLTDRDVIMMTGSLLVEPFLGFYSLGPAWVNAQDVFVGWDKQNYALKPGPKSEALQFITKHAVGYLAGAAGQWLWNKIGRGLVTQENMKTVAETMSMILVNGAGDLRFVSALLGLMNTFKIVATEPKLPEESRGYQHRMVGNKKVDYLIFKKLTIKLPENKPLESRIRNISAAIIHKRAHQVRGHYRTLHKGTGTQRDVWIKQHQRGDAALGYIEKEYEIDAGVSTTGGDREEDHDRS